MPTSTNSPSRNWCSTITGPSVRLRVRPAGSRLRALAAALPVIKERSAKLNPPPTCELPILIGGGGEKVTLRIVAEHAHVWHFFPGSTDELAHTVQVRHGHCADVGCDPAEIEISVGVHPHRIDRDPKYADDHYDLGARQITLGYGGPSFDLSSAQPWLDWRDEKNG